MLCSIKFPKLFLKIFFSEFLRIFSPLSIFSLNNWGKRLPKFWVSTQFVLLEFRIHNAFIPLIWKWIVTSRKSISHEINQVSAMNKLDSAISNHIFAVLHFNLIANHLSTRFACSNDDCEEKSFYIYSFYFMFSS